MLVATILASSIAYIDEFVVNVALPAMETDLATSVVVVQWLVNAYTLCLSAFLLTGGAAGDLFGRRRIFVDRHHGLRRRFTGVRTVGQHDGAHSGARDSRHRGGVADPVLAGDHRSDIR